MIKRLKALVSKRFAFRDAVTGRYVTKAYALLHQTTTIMEEIKWTP